MKNYRVLLDTNIIIHRETEKIINEDIGKLFYWLDKIKATKIIHPVTVQEIHKLKNKEKKQTFNIKLESYEKLVTDNNLEQPVQEMSLVYDSNESDINDTKLLNEVYRDRVDILITEDQKIHKKAKKIGISERVFSIESFLEKISVEYPDLIEYKVLSVQKSYFGKINLEDPFFDTLKEDYPGFKKWFYRKSNEPVYVSINDKNSILAFLYLKIEDEQEIYSDIKPPFSPKKRLKIATFKVKLNGFRLGERFLKIVFDNALRQRVEEIYVTIYEKRPEQKRLIALLENWGFKQWGIKVSTNELVYVRDFSPNFEINNPKKTFPYISLPEAKSIFIVPIYPKYHTELFPDSILRTESPEDFKEDKPHRNTISKVYISRSIERNVNRGDILLFYRTAEKGKSAYYSSVITTIGLVEEKIDNIKDEGDFILKCRKRSVFNDDELRKFWNYKPNIRPFIINFLHIFSFQLGQRINRARLLNIKVLSGSDNELRGLKKISKNDFKRIIKEAKIDESFIIY